MSNYGRNFSFRVPPSGGDYAGRYSLAGSTDLPIGVPVVLTGDTDDLGRLEVELATTAQAKPDPGTGGVLVFENGPAAYAGYDPMTTTYSDLDKAPAGAGVIVASGEDVKIVLTNTSDRTFLGTRSYAGRLMVAGVGATPTVAVGDMLTPSTGNDSAGYWEETSTAGEAWLIVTSVDATRGEVEARLNF